MAYNKKAQLGWIMILVIAIISVALVFKFWLGPHIFFKQVDSAHEIVEKTYDANNAIYNYEWFKTQYEKIQASEKQIDNLLLEIEDFKTMYGDPKEWDYVTKEEYSRLRTNYVGLKNHYENLVADYNARSNMDNRDIFKDGLPFNVDKKLWI